MATQPKPYLSVEQYLELDRAAERGSEYYKGEMFPMEAISLNHSTIVTNLTVMLQSQLRGQGCRQATGMRLRTQAGGPYFYPDVMVFCGRAQLEDPRRDTLLDAVVVMEVLSPSTARYDHTFKLEHYQAVPSLRDYLMLAQDCVKVAHKTCVTADTWETKETTDPQALIALPSIGCVFRVADIYEGVDYVLPDHSK